MLTYLWLNYGLDPTVEIDFKDITGEYSIERGGPNGGTGYADVVMYTPEATYVWEVKHAGGPAEESAPEEVQRYIAAIDACNRRTGEGSPGKVGFEIPGVQGPAPVPGNKNETVVAYSSKRVPGQGVFVYDVLDGNNQKRKPAPTATRTSLKSAINDTAKFMLYVSLVGAAQAAAATTAAGTLNASAEAAVSAAGGDAAGVGVLGGIETGTEEVVGDLFLVG